MRNLFKRMKKKVRPAGVVAKDCRNCKHLNKKFGWCLYNNCSLYDKWEPIAPKPVKGYQSWEWRPINEPHGKKCYNCHHNKTPGLLTGGCSLPDPCICVNKSEWKPKGE